ncbi:MAG: DUF3592 domain-containing protein [Myxococcota bacterium]
MGCLRFAILFALGIPGLMLMAVGGGFAYSTVYFMDHSVTTTGVITTTSPPTAVFEVEGETYEVRGSVNSEPPVYEHDENVTIYYDPNDPADARIDGFLENWFAATLIGGIGSVLAFFGLAGFFLVKGAGATITANLGEKIRQVSTVAQQLSQQAQANAAGETPESPPPQSVEPAMSDVTDSGPDGVSESDRQALSRLVRMGGRGEAMRYAQNQLGLSKRDAKALLRKLKD